MSVKDRYMDIQRTVVCLIYDKQNKQDTVLMVIIWVDRIIDFLDILIQSYFPEKGRCSPGYFMDGFGIIF